MHANSMLLPLQLRNQSARRDQHAQQLYSEFRASPFQHNDADGSADRGPGSLLHADANSIATRVQRKNLSLYKSPRDVNPTSPPAVDAFYDTSEVFDVARSKGNPAATLLSTTPRFDPASPRSVPHGPGSYSPERFTGAFPLLSDRVTPSTVRQEKRLARAHFNRAFAILPSSSAASTPSKLDAMGEEGRLMTRSRRVAVGASSASASVAPSRPGEMWPSAWQGVVVESTVLQAAVTPKTAYSDKATRQQLLLHLRLKQPQ